MVVGDEGTPVEGERHARYGWQRLHLERPQDVGGALGSWDEAVLDNDIVEGDVIAAAAGIITELNPANSGGAKSDFASQLSDRLLAEPDFCQPFVRPDTGMDLELVPITAIDDRSALDSLARHIIDVAEAAVRIDEQTHNRIPTRSPQP